MDVSQNTKNTDCYFYYYSTCSRENCPYRHEPSSRGCEITCLQWKEGKCTNPHCNLRHMEIKKKRNEISCYWENQPSGCLKAHCPFLHRNKDSSGQNAVPAGIPNKEPEVAIPPHEMPQWNIRANHEPLPGTANAPDAVRRMNQAGPEAYGSPPVEPVIVTFEEESDSESTQSTPTKTKVLKKDNFGVKTLEEIRLAEIQAEQAAYWENVAGGPIFWEDKPSTIPAERSILIPKTFRRSGTVRLSKESSKDQEKGLNFKVLTLEEIRRNRQACAQKEESVVSSASSTYRPSVLSRLGDREVDDDTSLVTRRVTSTTETRRTLKRVRSPVYVSQSLKRVQYDASSTLLGDADEFIKQLDKYLTK